MTFAELKAELSARGFAHLSDARLGLLINDAVADLDESFLWPYREDSAQGTAPLSIPTLGLVEAVSDESQDFPLEEIGYGDLNDWGVDLSQSGSPTYWYRSTPAGDPVVNTWPTSSDTIGVQFWRSTVELSADSDVPTAPSRFHLLYVLLAQQMAEYERGNMAAAQALDVPIQKRTTTMVNALLPQQAAKFTRVTGASFDS